MSSDTSCAAVTVNAADPQMLPDAALMFARPSARLVARPALLTLAVEGASELQVAVALRFCVLPSVKVPVAVNCSDVPNAIDGFAGLTAIDTRTAAVTVRVVLPLTEPEVAEMVAVPVPTPVASPI